MNTLNSDEWEGMQQRLGASGELIRQLEQQVMKQRAQWERDAAEWRRFRRHLSDLGDWLVDAATDSSGRIVKPVIDAALGGEQCVPGAFTVKTNGRRYQIALVSTHYEVKEE
jgi:hypothetical protein